MRGRVVRCGAGQSIRFTSRNDAPEIKHIALGAFGRLQCAMPSRALYRIPCVSHRRQAGGSRGRREAGGSPESRGWVSGPGALAGCKSERTCLLGNLLLMSPWRTVGWRSYRLSRDSGFQSPELRCKGGMKGSVRMASFWGASFLSGKCRK